MSKGTPRIALRVPPALRQEVEAAIERANAYRKGEGYDLTAFILSAIREKLAKMERSRSSRRRPDSGEAGPDTGEN